MFTLNTSQTYTHFPPLHLFSSYFVFVFNLQPVCSCLCRMYAVMDVRLSTGTGLTNQGPHT